MKTPAIILTLTTCLLSFSLLSMPTPDELEKVKPLVQDLMKSDLDAMKLGKKSRADVAKSAMSLYPQAESQAAKLLLARSAFNLYVKAGEYEAAEKALDALLSAVPDYPALEQAELLEKALYPVPYKAAPNLRARLAAIKDKAQAAGQLKSLLTGFDSMADGPKRKAVATRIATSYVSLGDWPNAVKYFALSDSPAASAAQAELHLVDEPEATRSYDKAANAWWSVELPKRDSKLALSFRAHSAELYAKALPTLTGLAKVQADRRIKEYESALVSMATKNTEAKTDTVVSKQSTGEWVHCEGGKAYLDTGIVPKSSMSIEWDVRFPEQFQGNKNFCGANTTGAGLCLNTDVKNAGVLEVYHDKWHSSSSDGGVPIQLGRRNLIRWDSKGIFVNNVLIKKFPIANCNATLVLFDRNRGGNAHGSSAECWVYGLRIKDKTKVLLDLKPKENGGVVGFWDSVRSRFMTPSEGRLKMGKD